MPDPAAARELVVQTAALGGLLVVIAVFGLLILAAYVAANRPQEVPHD